MSLDLVASEAIANEVLDDLNVNRAAIIGVTGIVYYFRHHLESFSIDDDVVVWEPLAPLRWSGCASFATPPCNSGAWGVAASRRYPLPLLHVSQQHGGGTAIAGSAAPLRNMCKAHTYPRLHDSFFHFSISGDVAVQVALSLLRRFGRVSFRYPTLRSWRFGRPRFPYWGARCTVRGRGWDCQIVGS